MSARNDVRTVLARIACTRARLDAVAALAASGQLRPLAGASYGFTYLPAAYAASQNGVNPKRPIRTLQELIAYAKANPGKINYSANTPGTFPNLAAELFAQRAGIKLTFVPYNGAMAAMQDIMGDRLDVAVEGVAPFTGAIKAGQLRPLADTSATRVASLPDVPAAGEVVPGYTAVGLYALMANSKVPDSIVRKINADVRQVLSRPEVAAKFAELSNYVKPMSPEETTAFIRKERTTWEAVIKQMGFTPR